MMSVIEFLFVLLNSIPMGVVTNPIEEIVRINLRKKWEKYYYGKGVKKNVDKAHKLFVKCISNGVIFDKDLLDEVSESMIQIFRGERKRVYLRIRASLFNDRISAFEMGEYYNTEKKAGYALYYYDIAARFGCINSQLTLISYYYGKCCFLEANKYNELAIANTVEELYQKEKIIAIDLRNNLKLNIQIHCNQCLKNKEEPNYDYIPYEFEWSKNYF